MFFLTPMCAPYTTKLPTRMALDDTVQRGDLGVVGSSTKCEAGERFVSFPGWEGQVSEMELNMCSWPKRGVDMI